MTQRDRSNSPGFDPLSLWSGMMVGAAISLLTWGLGWNILMERGGVALILVPALKIVAGIACLFVARWRRFGGGLLISLALGFMIFIGSCAAHI